MPPASGVLPPGGCYAVLRRRHGGVPPIHARPGHQRLQPEAGVDPRVERPCRLRHLGDAGRPAGLGRRHTVLLGRTRRDIGDARPGTCLLLRGSVLCTGDHHPRSLPEGGVCRVPDRHLDRGRGSHDAVATWGCKSQKRGYVAGPTDRRVRALRHQDLAASDLFHL